MNKISILLGFTNLLFLVLGLRLFQLQILENHKYKILAKNNSTRVAITRAPRGIVYDRNNNILATSKQSLSVVVYPFLLQDTNAKENVAKILAQTLSMSSEDTLKMFKEMDPSTPLPLTIDNDINIADAIKIFENYNHLPGILVEKQATRYYPYQELGSHFLGYVGQVSAEELKRRKSKYLGLGDIVGKDGLEKVFDESLRGENGEERVSVDRHGKIANIDTPSKKIIKKAKRGQDLHLTIDIDIQLAAEKAMKNINGAVVVINPKTGEIYALVSKPSFDPNIFTKPVPSNVYQELSKSNAFLNRVLSSYTPGSIWKPITSLAALEHKAITSEEKLAVSGAVMMGGFRFGDWTSKQDVLSLPMALAWSRNTFFYQVAKRMKPEWIADMGRSLGMGRPTNIELLGESSGLVPDPQWKKKQLKEPWFPGNTLHFAIGQSFLLVSPLQAVKMISSIATGGRVPQLHLVMDEKKNEPERFVEISKYSLDAVQEGLRLCVKQGTGGATRFENLTIAGKTGSAEVRGFKHSTHAWFIAYAPADPGKEPEIALALIGEGAGHGGSICAPIAREIFQAYLNKKKIT